MTTRHSRLRFLSLPDEVPSRLDGRVLLFISDDSTKEPRMQTDEYRAKMTRPIFGIDVDSLKPGQAAAIISDTTFGFPVRSLKDIPPGDYWVQALSQPLPDVPPERWEDAEASTRHAQRRAALGDEARQLL